MTPAEKNLALLGLKVTDRVTGLEGVVTSICFDLYGCVQAIINPGLDKDGKYFDSVYLDVGRLRVRYPGEPPVMPVPDFLSEKGPAEKPPQARPPLPLSPKASAL